jgi:hypothetical protein
MVKASKSDIISQLDFDSSTTEKKMCKEPDAKGRYEKSLEEMSEKDLFPRVMELFSNTKIPESKRRKMLEEMEKIALEPDEPVRQ